jgi:hypothetical protein
MFNEAADATQTVGNLQGRMIGSAIKATGDVVVDYLLNREISQGS